MDRNGVWYSWLVLRVVLLLEDESVIYLGATNGLFQSMIEHCRWISEPPWGTRWKASRFVREQHTGSGYPRGFRPKGLWCLREDACYLWRLLRFGDLRGLPAVQLQLLVPVVFRCRADLLSVLDCCRGVSCYGNRMFLASISLELELFWTRGTRFAPWAPGRMWSGSWWKGCCKRILDMRHLGLAPLGCDALEVDVCVLFPGKGTVRRRKIQVTLCTPSIEDGRCIVPLTIHGTSQENPAFLTSSRTDELDQRCSVSEESPLGQSILSGKRFGLFLVPQYAGWKSG